jgi:hypothetical protein
LPHRGNDFGSFAPCASHAKPGFAALPQNAHGVGKSGAGAKNLKKRAIKKIFRFSLLFPLFFAPK